MKPGSFIINGVYSEDVDAVIQSRPTLNTPRRKVAFKETYGQSGSLPYDEEEYANTELELLLYVGGQSAVVSREVIYSLFDSGKYMDLIMYSDPTKIYRVMMSEPPAFESRYYMEEGLTCTIKLSVLPYKFLVNSPVITLTAAKEVYNPTLWDAKPTIAIYGTGDVTFKIGTDSFSIRNVSGDVVLNSTIENAYQAKKKQIDGGSFYDLKEMEFLLEDVVPMNHKIYTRKYPTFSPGVNSVSWIGTVTRVDILPKWRTLV